MFDLRELFYRSDGSRRSTVNLLIIIVNISVFLYLETQGSTEDARFMFEHGAMFPPALFQDGEWYRIFASMFMHFGMAHLLNNMLVLFFIGDTLEKLIGPIRYVIIYVVSGVAGCVWSNYQMMQGGKDMAVSAGASGAIFGVFGAMLFTVIIHKGRAEGITLRRMLLFIALTLYSGYTTAGVDYSAHLGGLIAGFIVAVLIVRVRKQKGAEESQGDFSENHES